MMKNARLLLVAISFAGLAACSSPTAPVVQQEGYAGSGGQLSPADNAPSLTEGYAGSGG
jgi:hypothetical protein